MESIFIVWHKEEYVGTFFQMACLTPEEARAYIEKRIEEERTTANEGKSLMSDDDYWDSYVAREIEAFSITEYDIITHLETPVDAER